MDQIQALRPPKVINRTKYLYTIVINNTSHQADQIFATMFVMTNEQLIREYYLGWEKSDWGIIESKLADDFTFTSPFDDHLDKKTYKERCWRGVDSIHKYEFLTIMENGNEAFARWDCLINGKIVRNTEYFFIENGKIKTIEVYFGQPTK